MKTCPCKLGLAQPKGNFKNKSHCISDPIDGKILPVQGTEQPRNQQDYVASAKGNAKKTTGKR